MPHVPHGRLNGNQTKAAHVKACRLNHTQNTCLTGKEKPGLVIYEMNSYPTYPCSIPAGIHNSLLQSYNMPPLLPSRLTGARWPTSCTLVHGSIDNKRVTDR